MRFSSLVHKLLCGTFLAASAILPLHAQLPAAHKTQNVIVVMIDGLRWQEVFRGADSKLNEQPGPKWLNEPYQMGKEAQAKYVLSTSQESREALMPFLWKVVAKHGQIFGNRDRGSDSHVTN